jgi:predicted RecB family nuclease
MKQDDLTCLKHVGSSRMKLLNDSGITTITQLHEISLERLAEVKSIGEYYARLIKSSVSDYYKGRNSNLSIMPISSGEKKARDINRDLKKKIKRLRKILNRVNENFKPLWKKKYLVLYVEFKKRLTKLRSRLIALGRIIEDLPDEDKENIIKKADALILSLKNVGKKPKKKKYKVTILEIQSFSKFLKDIFSEF